MAGKGKGRGGEDEEEKGTSEGVASDAQCMLFLTCRTKSKVRCYVHDTTSTPGEHHSDGIITISTPMPAAHALF